MKFTGRKIEVTMTVLDIVVGESGLLTVVDEKMGGG